MKKSSQSYVFKRRLKKGFRKKAPFIFTSILFVSIFFSALLWAFPTLKYSITPFLRVNKIEFRNVFYNNEKDLKKVSEPYMGLMFWDVDKTKLEQELNAIPWVDYVKISSVPSPKLTVIVYEKQPFALFKDNEGIFWIINEHAEKITQFTPDFAYRTFPVISCNQDILSFVVKKLSILKTNHGDTFFRRLSELVIKDTEEKWVCFLEGFPSGILVDPFGSFENISDFLKVEGLIIAKYSKIDYVDLSFKKQIIIKESVNND